MRAVAEATTLAELASAFAYPAESSAVRELKAGSEQAYSWLIANFHQPVYRLVYRIVNDPADAADTTQEVFLKIFKGISRFHGDSSLKTWIYRIAVHEAYNRRRWWRRHKSREISFELPEQMESGQPASLEETLEDGGVSPFESLATKELRTRVEGELRKLGEPYRTTVILRDIEELSYEEITQVMQVSLGTVKSRLTRGREALKKRLAPHVDEMGMKEHKGKSAKAADGFGARVSASVRTEKISHATAGASLGAHAPARLDGAPALNVAQPAARLSEVEVHG